MQRRLLVLTASVWQVPVICTAKSMGLRVIATDRNPAAPALGMADDVEIVDTRDREAVLRLARRHRIDGIVAEQTDVAVATAAFVAESLALPGLGLDAATAATNKFVMRERCRAAGLPMPKYACVMSSEDAAAAAAEIGFPVVVKPLDAQSSRGVAKLQSRAEVAAWFETASGFSSDHSVIVEEMMVGAESSIEAFVSDGHVTTLGICEKVKCAPPYSFDLRLIYPASFDPKLIEEMILLNERIVRAVGIKMGITHGEYIVTAQGPRLIEIAARGCGAGVATRLVPVMTGVDAVRQRIRQALGEDVNLTRTRSLAGLLEFLMLPAGTLRKLDGIADVRKMSGVIDAGYFVQPGDVITPAQNAGQRPGFLLAVGRDHDELLRISRDVHSTIRYEVSS
jgi:carbamoyl-phosphate synthase large subunit